MILDAEVFEREGKVFMSKTCPSHGECEELYFGSSDMYDKFSTFWQDGKGMHAPNVMIEKCSCPNNCGLCSNHLSHSGPETFGRLTADLYAFAFGYCKIVGAFSWMMQHRT